MKLVQTTIEKTFWIEFEGKDYHVNYLNSDGQSLAMINRNNWEILDEDGEEVSFYVFKGDDSNEMKKAKENLKLTNKLISFCIKNFNRYKPV